MKYNKAFTMIEMFIVVAIFGILCAVVIPKAIPFFVDYSNGDRVGQLVKFSRKGIAFKTYEGQLKLGEATDMFFDFSVDNGAGHRENVESLVATLQSNVGKNLKITYVQRRVWPWNADTDYLVQSIEVLK